MARLQLQLEVSTRGLRLACQPSLFTKLTAALPSCTSLQGTFLFLVLGFQCQCGLCKTMTRQVLAC